MTIELYWLVLGDSPLLDVDGNPEVDATRVVTIVVSDESLDSEMARVTIQFMPVNDPPIITLDSRSAVIEFRDGDLQIFISPNVEKTDVDTRNLFSMTVILDSQAEDFLSDGEIEVRLLAYGSNTTAGLTSTGGILRRIMYINLVAEPSLNNRQIRIEVCDSRVSCSNATITVVIIDANDNPPAFTQQAYTFTVTEDVPFGFTVGSLTVFDPDPTATEPIIVSMSTSSSSPFVLNQDRSTVHIVTMQQLDFETTNSYFFTIVASDGVNQDVANITINVEDVNERPLIVLDSPAPSIIIGPGSESQLILVDIEISDPDFGDSVSESLLQLRNVPEGSVETLGWSEITGYNY